MRALLQALRLRFRRRRSDTYVQLTYEDGGHSTVGPMSQFAAEVYLVHRLWPEQRTRRVVRARLVLP